MNWFAQNWLWILIGLGALWFFGFAGHRRNRFSHHGYGASRESDQDYPYRGDHPSDASQHPGQPGLAIDPVTRKDVATERALTSIYQGRIYYFETAESRQTFEASPEQYARQGLGHSLAPTGGTVQQSHPRRGGGCCWVFTSI